MNGKWYEVILKAGTAVVGKVIIRNTANDADIDPLAESTFTGRVGAVEANPTSNTILARLKDLLTGIILAAGTNIIGKVRLVTSNGDEVTDDTTDAVKSLAVNDVAGAGMIFGRPTLMQCNHGVANWERGSKSPLDQKSATGWLVRLYGGVQTGDDWARVDIPVNELPVTSLTSAQWSYFMSATETMGVNIVVWVHDPADFDKRAEITQIGNHADLPKTAGWNAFQFSSATAGMFYYGEGTTGSALVAGTQYTWAQFQADVLFSTWTIYRITLEYGWEASGTFDEAFIADIKLNHTMIPLRPEGNTYTKKVLVSKILECDGGYAIGDVMSESDTPSAGTDWDIDFGGKGRITQAVVEHPTNGLDDRWTMFLFTSPPNCELDDNATNTAPTADDVPYMLPPVMFPALTSIGTGGSFSAATMSTYGNMPIYFDKPLLYGVTVTLDACDPGDDTLLSIIFDAEMEVS